MNNAEIIGTDLKACQGCCGGVEITIDNVPNPSNRDFYLARQMPSNFSIPINAKFPIAVKIDWQHDTVHCVGYYVIITRIASR